jgi:chemotaxis protein CheD
MIELAPELPQVYLHPGEMYIARRPTVLRTVLGSCVGITFWSRRRGIGALCHAVLPRRPPDLPADLAATEGFRYVDFCISDLARQLEVLGAVRRELQIKLFGGADVLPVSSKPSARATVGRQNWQAALEVMREENLDIMVSDLGGTRGCTLQFHTGTGEVLLRRLAKPVFEDEDL